MKQVLGFLLALHNKGLSNSTTGTARSALFNVTVNGNACKINFGSHALVSGFTKSVFLVSKPVSRYDTTCDVAMHVTEVSRNTLYS